MAKTRTAPAPMPGAPWQRSEALYLAGRAELDGADQAATEAEARWGVGRLRLVVSAELRERFDRQRVKLNDAITHGDVDSLRTEARRTVAAWRALDRAATEAGHEPLSPVVWEVALDDRSVARIVRTSHEAHALAADGRKAAVFTLAEIGKLLTHYRAVVQAKIAFPGAEVTACRKPAHDPVEGSLDLDWQAGDDLPPDLMPLDET